jgi:cell division protein FtsN
MNQWKKPVLIGGSVVVVAAAVLAFNIYAPDSRGMGTIETEALNAKAMDAEKADADMANAKSGGTAAMAAASEKTGSKKRKIASVGTVYIVQVGAFKVKENAEKVLAQLKAKGFAAEIHTIDHSKNGLLHIVRMQPMSDRSEAHAMVETLREKTQLAAAVMMEPAGGG